MPQAQKKAAAMAPQEVFDRAMPAEMTPDAFPNAQQTVYSMNQQPINDAERQVGMSALGLYTGKQYSLDQGTYSQPQVFLRPNAGGDTKVHEVGHSIFRDDLTPDQQTAWLNFAKANKDKYPLNIYDYGPTEGFAASWSDYANNPEYLQKTSPEIYNYLKNLAGFEFARHPQLNKERMQNPQGAQGATGSQMLQKNKQRALAATGGKDE